MTWFRRIFSSPSPHGSEKEADTTEEAAPSTVSDLPETAVHPSTDDTKEMTDVRSTADIFISSVADGATRPLPQDTFIPTAGNEHASFGQLTDVGKVRSNNQDAAFSFYSTTRSADEWPDFGLFLVADGMGGHQDGEKASAITARSVASQILKTLYLPMVQGKEDANDTPVNEALVEAVQKANTDVVAQVPEGGTTITAAIIIGDLAYIAHVGDSRIYLIHKGNIEQITRDHSLVQRLIELGQLTPEEAVDHKQPNVLYRALGQNESVEVDTLTRRLPPNSRLLLCSDGLWNQATDGEILDIVTKHPNPQEACNKLVALANMRGGIDNVTAILLKLPG
jgi:serine/threonine protein phosphatase PrpC